MLPGRHTELEYDSEITQTEAYLFHFATLSCNRPDADPLGSYSLIQHFLSGISQLRLVPLAACGRFPEVTRRVQDIF